MKIVPRLHSAGELEELRAGILSGRDPDKPCIAVCAGAACHGLDSRSVLSACEKEVRKPGLKAKVDVRATGCHGFCEKGPNVIVSPGEICYFEVKPEDVPEVVAHAAKGTVLDRLVYTHPETGEKAVHLDEVPFYKQQTRVLIGDNPKIDPTSIEDYIALGGYAALSKALFEMSPDKLLEEVKKANLRGRGGGGFPAGLKWETAKNAPSDDKYVIVNGHEGEPGAFMDRALFTGNPHKVLEGLIIGAYTIGSHQGFIYTRHDSPQLIEHIEKALAQAEEYGLLGEDILGSGFNFKVELHFDVGIFVSGESSALMRSIEGNPPEPRPKYIRTSVAGIWDKPASPPMNISMPTTLTAKKANATGTERTMNRNKSPMIRPPDEYHSIIGLRLHVRCTYYPDRTETGQTLLPKAKSQQAGWHTSATQGSRWSGYRSRHATTPRTPV